LSDYLKLPAVGGLISDSKIPQPLILQSTQGSDLNLGSDSSNVPVQNTTTSGDTRPTGGYVPF
jgi:hypothetical protein